MAYTLPSLLQRLNDIIVQPRCLLCESSLIENNTLCNECYARLPWMVGQCLRCGLSLPLQRYHSSCGACQQQTLSFDLTVSTFHYDQPIKAWLLGLKFNDALLHTRLLSRAMIERISHLYIGRPLPQAIIPVPLHRKRLRQRGFNQALELAKPIARHFQLPVLLDAAQRTRHTQAQAQLDPAQRISNMRNAFNVSDCPWSHVAVVDDILTTGNTVTALCDALKQAGVQQIDVWCCARVS